MFSFYLLSITLDSEAELDLTTDFAAVDSDSLKAFFATLSMVTAVQTPFASVAHAAVVAAG